MTGYSVNVSPKDARREIFLTLGEGKEL